jgi:outer membrane immunogenic protein
MRKLMMAGAAVAALLTGSIAAGAADLPRPLPQQVPVYPVYDWSGFYVGLEGGGGWGSAKFDLTNSFGTSGALFGGTMGYNVQFGTWVLGLEGDLAWSDIGGNTAAGCPAGCTVRNDWLGTVRGRVGFPAGNWLPYVTGGLALGDVKASAPGFAGMTSTQAGWTVGAGFEYGISRNWTAKLEYLYVDLGSFNCGPSCGPATTNNVGFTANIVRGGFDFRF